MFTPCPWPWDVAGTQPSLPPAALPQRCRGAEEPEPRRRARHGLPAAVLPEPLQEEGLVSGAWPRAGEDMHQPRGEGDKCALCCAWARLVLAQGMCITPCRRKDEWVPCFHSLGRNIRPMGSVPTREEKMLSHIPTSNQCVLGHPHVPGCGSWAAVSHTGCLCPSMLGTLQSSSCLGSWGVIARERAGRDVL